MSFLDDVKDIVGTVAPTIAGTLGGPLAGMGVRVLAEKFLGRPEAGEEEVAEAIRTASPSDLVRLKEIEADFKTTMKEAGVSLEGIHAGDRDSARKRQAAMGDWTPAVMGGLILVGFFAVLYVMMRYELPESTKPVMMVLVGGLAAMATQVVNYFFGSSSGSSRKNTIIEKLKGG